MEIKFQEKGYGQGFYDGQMQERKYWQDKIKAKIKEVQNMKAKAKDIVFKSSLNYIETELKSLLVKEFSTTITKEELEKIWKEKNK